MSTCPSSDISTLADLEASFASGPDTAKDCQSTQAPDTQQLSHQKPAPAANGTNAPPLTDSLTNNSSQHLVKPGHGQQSLHVQPAAISIEWQGLGCSYRSGGGTTVVLEGVWGKALPGQMQVRLDPTALLLRLKLQSQPLPGISYLTC